MPVRLQDLVHDVSHCWPFSRLVSQENENKVLHRIYLLAGTEASFRKLPPADDAVDGANKVR